MSAASRPIAKHGLRQLNNDRYDNNDNCGKEHHQGRQQIFVVHGTSR